MRFVIERNLVEQVDCPAAYTQIEEEVALLCSGRDEPIRPDATYVTADKLYIICTAQSKEQIRRRALVCAFAIHRLDTVREL